MVVSSFFDACFAQLLSDWLSTTRWSEALFELIRDFLEGAQLGFKFQMKFSAEGESAESQRAELRKWLDEIDSGEVDHPAFAALSERFSLSKSECSALRFFYLYRISDSFETYLDKLPEWEAVKRLARYCEADEQSILQILGPRSSLIRSGLGSPDVRALRLKKYGIEFGITDHVFAFITAGGNQSLASFLLETPAEPILPLSAHNLSTSTISAARTTLSTTRGKPFVLLYGKPGTGKSEFARSLSVSCGFTPCFLRHDRVTGNRSYSNLLLAARLVDPKSEVLVVDEADELLNLQSGIFGLSGDHGGIKKSMVNDFLDDTKIKMIFIANETWRIPDSILRRFTIHVGFEDFNLAQRSRIWNELDSEVGIFTDKDRAMLAARYKANPSRIKQVLDVCASLDESERTSNAMALSIAEEMLVRGDELLHGTIRRERRKISSYDPSFLNLDTPVSELMASIEMWKNSFAQEECGINILFYGVPGTGKTAFAHHLVERLGFQPIIKRASDLLSAWVGETEKKIRDAFREAEGTALILDEADSLIAAREGARAGWERTMTNEVLTCMEDFRGLFIASTNFQKILDNASLRRFTFKIEFRPTSPSQRRGLVESYFPGICLSESIWGEIASLDSLTPGDVATAANRLRYSSSCDSRKVLSALRDETKSRAPQQPRIGFRA